MFFSFFQNFDFFGCQGCKRWKKGPKWQKKLSVALHILGTIHHMVFIYETHLYSDNIFRVFFHFIKISILWVLRGVKGQEVVQNDKDSIMSHFISQEPFIIWFSFILQMCKMVISPGVFFNFKSLIFWVVRGLKWQKMVQYDKDFCLLHLIFQEPYIIW